MKPLCAITGSGGYVGSEIKRAFELRGWRVLELTRHPGDNPSAIPFQLDGPPLPPERLAGVQALVHCAYDFRPNRWDEIRAVNVEGTRALLDAAAAAGVRKVVCISSMSAYPGCRSLYGKAKLEIEQLAAARNALAIRPGLVYGNRPRAMFGKLVEQVRRSVVLPIFGDGSQIQYLVHCDDLSEFIIRFAEGDVSLPSHAVSAAHERSWTFRELLLEIGRGLGRRPWLIPVPWRLVWAGLKGCETLGVPTPFRSDSLLSLMHQNASPDFSGNKDLSLNCRPFKISTIALEPPASNK